MLEILAPIGLVGASFFLLPRAIRLLGYDPGNSRSWKANSVRNLLNICYGVQRMLPRFMLGEDGGTIKQIIIYPIKSCGSIRVNQWIMGRHGFYYDRQFMFSSWNEKDNRFNGITQRDYPQMTLIQLEFVCTSDNIYDGHFVVKFPITRDGVVNYVSFELPAKIDSEFLISQQKDNVQPVDLWGVKFECFDIGNCVPKEFRDAVGFKDDVTLLWSQEGKFCKVGSPQPNTFTQGVGRGEYRMTRFQDYYPALMLSQTDIEHLGSKLKENNSELSADVLCFRPNLVIAGEHGPHETDSWAQFLIINKDTKEENLWSIAQKCPRCTVPNVDLETGEMNKKFPISKTLAKYRRIDSGSKYDSFFGVYVINHDDGYEINVGDSITILGRKITEYVTPDH